MDELKTLMARHMNTAPRDLVGKPPRRAQAKKVDGNSLLDKSTIGKKGRKTGVRRTGKFVRDWDNLDNVDDFFHSSEEEEEEEEEEEAPKQEKTKIRVSLSKMPSNPDFESEDMDVDISEYSEIEQTEEEDPPQMEEDQQVGEEIEPDMEQEFEENEQDDEEDKIVIPPPKFLPVPQRSQREISSNYMDEEFDIADDLVPQTFIPSSVGRRGPFRKSSSIGVVGSPFFASPIADQSQSIDINSPIANSPGMGYNSPNITEEFVEKKKKQPKKATKRKQQVATQSQLVYGGLDTTSKRATRVPPLAFWNNEAVVYKREDKACVTVVDIVRNPNQEENFPRRTKRDAGPPPVPIKPATVLDVDGETEITVQVAKNTGMLSFRSLRPSTIATYDGSAVTSPVSISTPKKGANEIERNCKVKTALAFSSASFSTGSIMMAPGAATDVQRTGKRQESFVVSSGQLVVKVYKTKYTLPSGSHIVIPPYNKFVFKNSSETSKCSITFTCITMPKTAGKRK